MPEGYFDTLKKPKTWVTIILMFGAGFAAAWYMNKSERTRNLPLITYEKNVNKSLEEVLELTRDNNDYFLVKSICNKMLLENPDVDSVKIMEESGLKYFKLLSDSTLLYDKSVKGAGDGFFLGSFLQNYQIDTTGIYFKYRGDKLLKPNKITHKDTGLSISVYLNWNQLNFCRK
ncbi:MAG: hypothetical protein RLZZ252_477 [Bacteroidota bacterium]